MTGDVERERERDGQRHATKMLRRTGDAAACGQRVKPLVHRVGPLLWTVLVIN